MSVRVTASMIEERAALGGYPFVRVVRAREPGMVEVHTATWATKTREGWRIDDSVLEVRQGTEEELAQLEANRSELSRAIEQQYAPKSSAGLLEELSKIRDKQTEAAASATCGCVDEPDAARPCSDAEETACFYGPELIRDLTTVGERTRQRPPSCPRKRAWLASRTSRPDEIQARCVARRIPADAIRVLTGPPEKIQDRPALQIVRDWNPKPMSFLVLCASNQAGKTVAACRWLASLGKGGLFLSNADIRNAILPDPEHLAYQLIRHANNAPALVIDNIDADDTDGVKKTIESFIIKFHGAARRIIMTTSLAPADFLNMWRVGEARTGPVFERLAQYGMIVEVPPWNP